jgi:hypothetical protein
LDEYGLEPQIVFNEFGKRSELSDYEISAIKGTMESAAMDATTVTFRVQIGAYRYKLSKNVFNNVNDLLVIRGSDGLTRYVSGSFKGIRSAAEHKVDLLLEGFEGAFVTAYRGGKRISLKEAGATVSGSENDITTAEETESINKDLVKFTVQLGSFSGRVPADVLNKFMTHGNVRPVRSESGTTKYVSGIFNSMQGAQKAVEKAKAKGFEEAFVAGEFNGQIIAADEAQKIKND